MEEQQRPLELEREMRAIQKLMGRMDWAEQTPTRDQVRIEVAWEPAIRPKDLAFLLRQHRPDIVHFSGHGTKNGELLFEDEVARIEAAAAQDVRCHALVLLLLSTGLKKEEVMGLTPGNVDLSDPEHPAIEVRFPGQAKRWRERRMELPAAWTEVYQRYAQRYQPQERVFTCTDRNLNYVLASAVRRAGIQKRVTLQLLRDIYAVRQLRAGVSLDTLRERLGLSEEAWYETAEKYRKLAFPV